MAGWLCRLQPEQLCDGPDCFEGAEAWGITGWVLCGLTPDQLALGPDRWLSQLNAAASVVLEINATLTGKPCPTTGLRCWRRGCHTPALCTGTTPTVAVERLGGTRGIDSSLCVVGPFPCGRGCGGVCRRCRACGSHPNGLPAFSAVAHARRSPDGVLIPAVRALPPDGPTGWLHASAEAYDEWLQLSNATADLLSPDGSGLVLLDSWNGHQAWYQAAEAKDVDGTSPAVVPTLRRCWGRPEPCHRALMAWLLPGSPGGDADPW